MPKVEVLQYQPNVAQNAQSSVSTSILCGQLLAVDSYFVFPQSLFPL